jgi:hypothetical protein
MFPSFIPLLTSSQRQRNNIITIAGYIDQCKALFLKSIIPFSPGAFDEIK